MVGSGFFLPAGSGSEKVRQDKGLAVFAGGETPCTCGCPACAGRILVDFRRKIAENALETEENRAAAPGNRRKRRQFAKMPEGRARTGGILQGVKACARQAALAQTCRLHAGLLLPAGAVALVCMQAAGKLHLAAVAWRSNKSGQSGKIVMILFYELT